MASPTLASLDRADKDEAQPMGGLTASPHVNPWTSQAKTAAIEDMQRRLHKALQEASEEAQRRRALEEAVEQGKAREAALTRRAEKAEEGEEALAAQLADTEAEAYMIITQSGSRLGPYSSLQDDEDKDFSGQICEISDLSIHEVEALRRRLQKTEVDLGTVQAKLQQSEEEIAALQLRLAAYENLHGSDNDVPLPGQQITLRKKGHQGGRVEETQAAAGHHEGDDLLSLSVKDVAGFMKFRLWKPSSLTVTASR